MSEEELKEIFKDLEAQGWKPMLCDTPVPFYENGVPAGLPNDMGDYNGEYLLLPRQLVGYEPMMMIQVRGESMCGAGIENGDIVTLLVRDTAEDGDVVMAWLDGEATLKVFYRDEEGEAWLVPQNQKYQPIRMSEFTTVRILGCVIDVKKPVGRVPFRQIQQQMRSVKRADDAQVLTDAVVKRAIQKIVQKMTTSRQWFCVYRVLVDKELLDDGDFYGLRDKMNELFPDNDFNINPRDLQRLDVDSFHKKLIFWDEHDAPVQGKRFYEYLTIANTFRDMLA